ncbi:hypothetical protein [Ktedonospora formicarum]|uniref:hypothetical protein n=1 Tax=Ktedonospora formicarum TaxID=2778364 RepID=UPI001C692505|nr:hypothetical protein [Ktedonospora formicarum]
MVRTRKSDVYFPSEESEWELSSGNEHEDEGVSGRLYYDRSYQMLQLHGQRLTTQMWIAIRIFHDWIPGQVQKDAAGWYLQTPTQSGIRLSAGLTARFCSRPFSSFQDIPW